MYTVSNEDLTLIKNWLGSGSINIFGLPFSGKDTHGEWLSQVLGASLLGGGQIMRSSVIPEHVKKTIDAGGLAPTDEYMRIVLPYLSSDEFKGRPLVLSSVGRWHGEEGGVLGAAEESGHPIKAVIYLDISPAVAKKRFDHSQQKGDRAGRVDDVETKLVTRFQEFTTKTLPVIAYYAKQNLLIDVDGNPSIDEVRTEIIRCLVEFAKRGS